MVKLTNEFTAFISRYALELWAGIAVVLVLAAVILLIVVSQRRF